MGLSRGELALSVASSSETGEFITVERRGTLRLPSQSFASKQGRTVRTFVACGDPIDETGPDALVVPLVPLTIALGSRQGFGLTFLFIRCNSPRSTTTGFGSNRRAGPLPKDFALLGLALLVTLAWASAENERTRSILKIRA